jgi:type VI secretion system protein ImpA
MSTAPMVIDDLLDPISPDQPAGVDLRWTPEWDRIKEARRSDDGLDSGKWAKRDRKVSNWRLVQEFSAAMLRERSKDLQLAMWWTEANIKLIGFAGLRDGLRLSRELIVRYWDNGLYPPIETGPEDRAGPLQWLNDKLVDSITAIPITVRSDQGRDYSFTDLKEARDVGSEAKYRTEDGEIDDDKKKIFDQAIAAGKVSKDHFERAVKETKRADYEEFHSDFQQCYEEFRLLEKMIDEKFGNEAPVLSACRSTLAELKQEISDIMDRKRLDEPDAVPASPAKSAPSSPDNPIGSPEAPAERVDSVVVRFPLSLPNMQGSQPAGSSWNEAEMLIRSGQVDRGLAEMTRLAASETSGRNRFQRKLLLAEVCLATKRERLARSILEELAEQIEKFQLELWETSELIGGVWTRLYKLYKQSEAHAADADRAQKLYERLCRLDPWQALACGEA